MIDINKIEKEFEKYTSNYDPSNGRIKLKIDHIKRVANNSKIIAKNLNLSQEQINLAIAIGYFHDIGRFEQVKLSNTFSDKNSGINHGKLGAKVLFEDNLIRNFIPETQYDNIIKKAILNHNIPAIETNLSNEELLFCQIIRDADKLDILYTISDDNYSMESIFWYPNFDSTEISENILNEFKQGKTITYSNLKNNGDIICIFYAYIYDLYFKISKKIIYEKNYLNTFTNRVYKTFPSPIIHKQTEEILNISNNYLYSTIQEA